MATVHTGQIQTLITQLPAGQPVIITAAALQYMVATIGAAALAVPFVQANGKQPISLLDLKGF